MGHFFGFRLGMKSSEQMEVASIWLENLWIMSCRKTQKHGDTDAYSDDQRHVLVFTWCQFDMLMYELKAPRWIENGPIVQTLKAQ